MNIEEALRSLETKIETFKKPGIKEELEVLSELFEVMLIPSDQPIDYIDECADYFIIECYFETYRISHSIIRSNDPIKAAKIYLLKKDIDRHLYNIESYHSSIKQHTVLMEEAQQRLKELEKE